MSYSLELLPDEIITEILNYLVDSKDVFNFMLVSKECYGFMYNKNIINYYGYVCIYVRYKIDKNKEKEFINQIKNCYHFVTCVIVSGYYERIENFFLKEKNHQMKILHHRYLAMNIEGSDVAFIDMIDKYDSKVSKIGLIGCLNTSAIMSLLILEDNRLVFGHKNGKITIAERYGNNGNKIMKITTVLEKHTNEVNNIIQLKSNPNLLVSCSSDWTLILWDISRENEWSIKQYRHDFYVLSVIELNENMIMSSDGNGKIIIWDIVKHLMVKVISFHKNSNVWKIIRINRNLFCSCSDDQTIQIFNPFDIYKEIMKKISIIKCQSRVLTIASLSNNRIASFSANNCLEIWDINSLRLIKQIKENLKNIYEFGYWNIIEIESPHIIALSVPFEGIRIWNIQKGKRIFNNNINNCKYVLAQKFLSL